MWRHYSILTSDLPAVQIVDISCLNKMLSYRRETALQGVL